MSRLLAREPAAGPGRGDEVIPRTARAGSFVYVCMYVCMYSSVVIVVV